MASHSGANGLVGLLMVISFTCFLCAYLRRMRLRRLAMKQQIYREPVVVTVDGSYAFASEFYSYPSHEMWTPYIIDQQPPPAYTEPITSLVSSSDGSSISEHPPTYEQALAQAVPVTDTPATLPSATNSPAKPPQADDNAPSDSNCA
uniref:Uncharacterized protein n=1 Tax=Plectus sambesii TaxID=2011161 RepID=A0A914XFB2_9BILA